MSISDMHDMLVDCWHQFSITIEYEGEQWMSDGALSTLEALADYLVEANYLVKHPNKTLYQVK